MQLSIIKENQKDIGGTKMKKILAMLLAIVMVFSLAACGGEETTESGESTYKVAMITDYGEITDQSFNQTTWEACTKFGADHDIETKYYRPTTSDIAARVAAVDLAVAEGYNVIVLPGFAHGSTIAEVSEVYPEVKFIALDVAAGDILETAVALKGESYDYNPDNWNLTDYVYMDNVYCAIYQEHLAGYMAGYAVVKLGYTDIGYLGGMAVGSVMRYGYGFVQGMDAAAKELGITVDLKYVYGNQFVADADITAFTDTWYANGTEIVFSCGGAIWHSPAESAKKYNGKMVGVDVDQAGIIDGTYGEGMTVTSAMKGLGPSTYDTLVDVIVNDNWAKYSGKIEALGIISEEPTANYVQLAGSTQYVDGKFTEEDYKAMVKAMFDGSIVVSDDISKEPTPTNVNVMWLGTVK